MQLYYGLKAEQLLSIPDEKVMAFCEKKGIELVDFTIIRMDAEIELNRRQISKDSIATMEIYKAIEENLGIK